MKNEEKFIHSLWINNQEGKIEIYINILENKLIFYGKFKIKIESVKSWEIFSRKEYSIDNNDANFEKACKEVYSEMKKNLQLLEGVQNYLKETTQIEINI